MLHDDAAAGTWACHCVTCMLQCMAYLIDNTCSVRLNCQQRTRAAAQAMLWPQICESKVWPLRFGTLARLWTDHIVSKPLVIHCVEVVKHLLNYSHDEQCHFTAACEWIVFANTLPLILHKIDIQDAWKGDFTLPAREARCTSLY